MDGAAVDDPGGDRDGGRRLTPELELEDLRNFGLSAVGFHNTDCETRLDAGPFGVR